MVNNSNYFTEFTVSKALLYSIATIYVAAVSVVMVLEPFVKFSCVETSGVEHPNVDYKAEDCQFNRKAQLLYLNRQECLYGRRLLVSVILGGIIGWERRTADRPAGIRTMSLVSLGSALFTLSSMFAFLSGPMGWDASRVSAAIPSGVGFLGAGIIYKEAVPESEESNATHVVHGLTTAASLWLSAAVGIACGGGLYFPASLSTAIILVLLRFGPRSNLPDHDHESETSAEALDHIRDLEYSSTSDRITKKYDDVSSMGSENKGLLIRKKSSLNLSRPQLV